jgi:hypothetical protein
MSTSKASTFNKYAPEERRAPTPGNEKGAVDASGSKNVIHSDITEGSQVIIIVIFVIVVAHRVHWVGIVGHQLFFKGFTLLFSGLKFSLDHGRKGKEHKD